MCISRGERVSCVALTIILAQASLLGAQRTEVAVPYQTHANRDQVLDLYVPAAAVHAPVVLFIHGGSLEESGERRDSPMYASVCPGLAQRGIICATMDYRLAPSYQWPAMPQDVAAAVRWLHDSIGPRGGDSGRLFLLGHSSGCHLATLVALDSSYLGEQRLGPTDLAGVVAMGCTMAPWDTAAMGMSSAQLEAAFQNDAEEVGVYGTLSWRLRANPMRWVGSHAPPLLVLVAESERFMPPVLEEGARLVRRLRELDRPADLRILPGRRHVTTTTGFADARDPVANLVAEFVRDPVKVTATP